MTKRKALYFDALGKLSVRQEALSESAADQVLVQTMMSVISAGTEMLFYRGQAPTGMPVDETIPSLNRELRYPLKYGYAAVGRVIALGKDVSEDWQGRLVVPFNPHESHFLISPNELIRIPDSLVPRDSVFLPNVETAVNLVMDGHPLIGE